MSERKWQHSINIKRHFEDHDLDPNDPLPQSIRDRVAAELGRLPDDLRASYDFGTDSLGELLSYLANPGDIDTVDAFNNWLVDLYDWADNARVWLGL